MPPSVQDCLDTFMKRKIWEKRRMQQKTPPAYKKKVFG